MAYEARHLKRPKVRYNNANDDNPLVMQLVSGGAKLTPTAATIQILNPSGTEIVAATATGITISGTLITYKVLTTTTASYPVDTGYRAHWIITSSTLTYEEDQIFDVAKMVPLGRITRDQLVALDDRVKAMEHAGDEDFSELIEATHDIVQMHIEAKATEDGQLLEDMLLDQTRPAIAARMLTLSHLFREKGFPEEAAYYKDQFDDMMRMLLASVKYDANQDLAEDSTQGHTITSRFVT